LRLTLKFAEDGFNEVEGFVQLLPGFGPRKHYFATDEDQHDEFRLGQPINQPREKLWVVLTKAVVLVGEAFQTDRELQVARRNDILNLKVTELNCVPDLFDGLRIQLGGLPTDIFTLRPRAHHFPRPEDQCRRLRLPDPHDTRGEPLGIVLAIASIQCDFP